MAEYDVGINRQIIIATESSFGVQGAGPGQLLRRTWVSMEPAPPEAQSQEITQDAQILDAFLGMPAVQGQLTGQLSPGTYKMIFEGLVRGTWAATSAIASISDSALTIGGDGTITFSSATSNFLTSGIKNGMIVRLTGATAGRAGINSINLLVLAVAANALTMAPNAAAVAWTASTESSITLTPVGKRVMMPQIANQVDRSFSIEDWRSVTAQSQLARGVKFGSISLSVNPNGYVNFQASFAGKNIDRSGTQVYSTPGTQSTSVGVRPVSGTVAYAGAVIGYVSGFNLQMSQALQPAQVIGAVDGSPKIAVGTLMARGSMQVLSTDDTLTTDFLSQNDVQLTLFLPTGAQASADFVSVYIPRARLVGRQEQDSDRLIMRSFNFSTLQKASGSGTGTAYDNTGLVIQDSLA